MTRPSLPHGERVHLRMLGPTDRDAFLEAVRRSRRLHHPWARPPATPEDYAAYVRRSPSQRTFGVIRTADDALVGVVNLSQIFRGRFGNAFLGYNAFTPHAGKGYLREALGLVTRYAFDDLGLHRIQANVQPGNSRSIELVRASGFRLEGASPRYLHIDGAWRDHLSWVLLADGAPEDEVLGGAGSVTLHRVTSATWRTVAGVEPKREQRRWVADVTRYLARCLYSGVWSPLEIRADGAVVGFAMWGRDPDDGSYWIGGFVMDRRHQGKGHGGAALEAMIGFLGAMPGARQVALSYRPDNAVAAHLYARAGFVETGEVDDDEVIARLDLRARRRS